MRPASRRHAARRVLIIDRRLSAVLLATVATLSVAGGIYLILDEGSDGLYHVMYSHDGQTIKEASAGGLVCLWDPDPAYFTDRTFFGWIAAELSGDLLRPGEQVRVTGDLSLCTATVDGNIVFLPGNGVGFDTARIPADGRIVADFRYIDGDIGYMTVSAGTLALTGPSQASLSILFADGTVLEFDGRTVADMRDISAGRAVDIGFEWSEDGLDLTIASGSVRLTEISGEISAILPLDARNASAVKAFSPSDGRGHEFEVSVRGDTVFLSTDEPGYRFAVLFGVEVRDDRGALMAEDSEHYPTLVSDSEDYEAWGMFAAGDEFIVTGSGYRFGATGTDCRDGVHKVAGRGTVVLSAQPGSYMHRVILPSEQTGYTLTADMLEVPDGGRCMIKYSLIPGYADGEKVIRVDGKIAELDGFNRLILDDVRSDRVITVSGVQDGRTYQVILPGETEGYIVQSTKASVNHGNSYTLTFSLLPDYEKGPGFGLRINGEEQTLVSDSVTVEDVTSKQEVAVTGVRLITYNISSGNNVVLKVGGYVVDRATCRDVIELDIADGYGMPADYNATLPVTIHPEGTGYTVSGDSDFPGISKLIVGKNVMINQAPINSTIYVSTAEGLKVEPSFGYDFPEKYEELVLINNTTDSKNKVYFKCDTNLKSIFKVTYLKNEEVFSTIFQIEGDSLKSIDKEPSRLAYIFDGWADCPEYVYEDLEIYSKWIPIKYTVSFGNNIVYTINGISNTSNGQYVLTVEDTITIRPKDGYELPNRYIPLSVVSGEMDGTYHVIKDVEFRTICKLKYVNGDYEKSFFYSKGDNIHLFNNTSPQLSNLFDENEDRDFKGWSSSGVEYFNEFQINSDHILIAMWG